MKRICAQRLLNAATALRESEQPSKFDMIKYVNQCGTPACVFGHYAARTDMQNLIQISKLWDGFTLEYTERTQLAYNDKNLTQLYKGADYDDDLVLEHFGITYDESNDLFSHVGCNHARTAIKAAEYIENFLADKGWYIKEVAA